MDERFEKDGEGGGVEEDVVKVRVARSGRDRLRANSGAGRLDSSAVPGRALRRPRRSTRDRWLDRPMRPRRIVPVVFIATASCGTLVQVVDDREVPIAAAHVQLIYPSLNGPEAMTDARGYARLSDSWLNRPAFSMVPAWVWVSTPAGRWTFDYPPPSVLHLDPDRMEQHHHKAVQPDEVLSELGRAQNRCSRSPADPRAAW
jgi:hypothetical protein